MVSRYFQFASCLAILVLLAGLSSASAQDWPRFRGPNGSGVSEAEGFPSEVNPADVLWKTDIPPGKSSPILSGDRLFLTAHEEDKRYLICLDPETGRELWRGETLVDREEHRHKLNDPAAPTPASDGHNVYAFFADFGLVAYLHDGGERWKQPLGPFASLNGVATSPIYTEGKLILQMDQTEGSYLAAFDPEDGEIVWKTTRQDWTGGYSTPVIHSSESGGEIIAIGPAELAAYSLEKGQKLWWVKGLALQPKSGPVLGNDMLFVNVIGAGESARPFDEFVTQLDTDKSGTVEISESANLSFRRLLDSFDHDGNGSVDEQEYTANISKDTAAGGTLAILLGGRGDVSDSHVAWRHRRSLPDVPSPLLYRDVLYLLRNGGIMTSLDPTTGEIHKRGRIRGAIDSYYSSPVAGSGKIYALSETGKLTVIQAGAQWEVLQTIELGEDGYASPALADGSLYVRTIESLYRFGTSD